jgi:hypothetical protein
MNIRIMKSSQTTKRETARLSRKMVMMGQLKNRMPRANMKIQISLLIGNPEERKVE